MLSQQASRRVNGGSAPFHGEPAGYNGGGGPAAPARCGAADLGRRPYRLETRSYRNQRPAGLVDLHRRYAEQLPELQRFGWDVKAAAFRHVVLLGMGGSSLGPEVLRQTFGSAEGYPELVVLDSTLPGLVGEATRRVDPGETMFLVSSKSGSTIEPNTLYAHFRARVVEAVGMKNAGGNFAAVTDPGTVLERLAREAGFRRAFLNPPEIGGRYSVLSYFGLVPAALTGLDLGLLLDRADKIRHECGPEFDPETNPGALLGLVMAAAQREGRDKLTVVASPGIASVGLWVEQMLAESLGKEGTGIIPVAGEPVMGPEAYGKDRLFVYLRLAGDDNGAGDLACESLMTAGHSVLQLDLADRYDLGGEFFRWEFATAVAGAVLGIHPFDQPDVQSAKDRTDAMLDDYQARGELPPAEDVGSLGQVLEEAGARDYLSVLVYARQTPEMDGTLAELRRLVMGKYRIATTVGYGPRYLHSTGQLHKGGSGFRVVLASGGGTPGRRKHSRISVFLWSAQRCSVERGLPSSRGTGPAVCQG